MKKLFTLLSLVLVITFAKAQRHADLQVTAVSPSGTVMSNAPISLDCKIKNLGPDVVKASDTINLFLMLGTTVYTPALKTLLNSAFTVGEEKSINVTQGVIKVTGNQPTVTTNICTYAYIFNRSATDSVNDLVASNNSGCNSVTLQWATGISNVAGDFIMEGISAYPNPAVNETKITYSLNQNSDIRISVMDLTGREVLQVLNEKQSTGIYEKQLDLSFLKAGVYFVQYNVGDKVYTSKLIKN